MKIRNNYYLIGLAVVLLVSGCGQPAKDEDKEKSKKPTGFKTNRASFINTLDNDSPSRKNRNAYMDEFLIKSDVQCQQYLNKPLSASNGKKQGMYMKVFDATSQAFGVKNITDGAKKLYSGGDDEKSKEAKLAYENALSPELKQGVEIAREKYAQRNMHSKKYKLIESYTNAMLERDMQNYDKLCSHEVGLIEINKALKRMQKSPKEVTPFSPKLVIDPVAIRNKVEAVTEKIEAENETETVISSEAEDLNQTGNKIN